MKNTEQNDTLIFDHRDNSIKFMPKEKLAYMAPEVYQLIELSETNDHIRTTLTDANGTDHVLILDQKDTERQFTLLTQFIEDNKISLDECTRKTVVCLSSITMLKYEGGKEAFHELMFVKKGI